LDLLALRIAKSWNREPNWFYSLDSETQIKVLAAYRLETSTSEEIKDRQAKIKRAKMEAMISKAMGE
jgi:hypothetical protein